MPPFSVFHTPPDAAPSQICRGSSTTASTAVMRPLIPAGPMLRGFMSEKRDRTDDGCWVKPKGPERMRPVSIRQAARLGDFT